MFLIIPAKPLKQTKTRLSPVLSMKQRMQLSRQLLLRTIQIAGQVGQVVVISRDRTIRRLAKEVGAWALVEAGADLNDAIRQAVEWVVGRRGHTVLILPGDLPFLTPADLQAMIHLGENEPAVVIAPCHRQEGTNALLIHPPKLIDIAFGSGSFEKHRQAVEAIGIAPKIYRSPSVAFDLDLPEDLEKLRGQLTEPYDNG